MDLAIFKRAFDSLRRYKIDFADLYFESSAAHSISFEDGALEEISSSLREGVGARVVREDVTSYSHTPGVAVTNGLSALRESTRNIGIPLSWENEGDFQRRIIKQTAFVAPPETQFLRDIDRKIREASPYVSQVSINYSLSLKNIIIINQEEDLFRENRPYTSFSVEVTVEKNGQIQTGYENAARLEVPNIFWGKYTPWILANQALKQALLMLDAPDCPAGTMSVILSGEAGGTLVHEACGHGLEADIIQKDFSVYRNKIGHKVASPLVTMIDDGTLPGLFGSYTIDDEGVPAQRTVLIEEGVLKGFLTDKISAAKEGLPLSGNGRRDSYRNPPIPRMSNTFILPGDSNEEAMIQSVDYGLYVKKMGGGEVNPTSGDFVFYVTEGYFIRNGSIAHPVKGALLTGNGPQALMDIRAVGDNLLYLPGMCGKAGQSVPVTDGQPALLIKKLIVGGNVTDHESL